MAFVARSRVGVGPEVKTESQREGRKSAMIAGFWDLGLVVCAMVWLVGWGWSWRVVWRVGFVVEGFGGWVVLVLFAGYLTDGYGVGCGRQAGRQCLV